MMFVARAGKKFFKTASSVSAVRPLKNGLMETTSPNKVIITGKEKSDPLQGTVMDGNRVSAII